MRFGSGLIVVALLASGCAAEQAGPVEVLGDAETAAEQMGVADLRGGTHVYQPVDVPPPLPSSGDCSLADVVDDDVTFDHETIGTDSDEWLVPDRIAVLRLPSSDPDRLADDLQGALDECLGDVGDFLDAAASDTPTQVRLSVSIDWHGYTVVRQFRGLSSPTRSFDGEVDGHRLQGELSVWSIDLLPDDDALWVAVAYMDVPEFDSRPYGWLPFGEDIDPVMAFLADRVAAAAER